MDLPIKINVDNETTLFINNTKNSITISILKETENKQILFIRSVEEILKLLTEDIEKGKKVKAVVKRVK